MRTKAEGDLRRARERVGVKPRGRRRRRGLGQDAQQRVRDLGAGVRRARDDPARGRPEP